jgi:hypothetical protein
MAINKGKDLFIGTRNVLTGYMAGGQNIVRARSSLTGERVKDDPAFAGFRKSSDRMKQASVMASALYNQIPKELKRFSLYRQLTGEAFKMLKQGKDHIDIFEKLQVLYIAPILEQLVTPASAARHKEIKK